MKSLPRGSLKLTTRGHHTCRITPALAGSGRYSTASSPRESEESAESLGARVLLHRRQSAGEYLVAKALGEGSRDRENRPHRSAPDAAWATANPQQPAPGGEQGSGEDTGGPGMEAGNDTERLHGVHGCGSEGSAAGLTYD
jgi:hypothetical protein